MCPAVAYEMLVSHSPPVFSHSPPTSFLSNYPSFRLSSDNFSSISRGSSCRSMPSNSVFFNKPHSHKTVSPKRPCLVIRPAEESSGSSDEDPSSPTKLKKKVVFADDKGMSLTHVRVMTEPSNVPPMWSFKFLSEVTQGLSAEPEAKSEPWEISFPQPASDYVDFRQKLDSNKVSLENVIVKEADDIIMGTVKVSNLSYHKEVFVRASTDAWKTFEDAFCNFVATSASTTNTAAYVLYDTFSFKLPLPPKGRKIEFCVCFKCNEMEYWDNNGGKNYIIVKKIQTPSLHKSYSADNVYKKADPLKAPGPNTKAHYQDATQTKLNSWSEFASWAHLDNSSPYW